MRVEMPVALPDSNNYFPGLNHMQPDKVSHYFETPFSPLIRLKELGMFGPEKW